MGKLCVPSPEGSPEATVGNETIEGCPRAEPLFILLGNEDKSGINFVWSWRLK